MGFTTSTTRCTLLGFIRNENCAKLGELCFELNNPGLVGVYWLGWFRDAGTTTNVTGQAVFSIEVSAT